VLATEIPWLTANTPNIKNSQEANQAIEQHVIAPLKNTIEYEQYRTEFQGEKGTLVGAEQAWQGYRKANPVYDPATGKPPANNETPAQYFTRTAADPTQVGKPAASATGAPVAGNPAGPGGPKASGPVNGVIYRDAKGNTARYDAASGQYVPITAGP
jgi:hypothetical protein